MTLPIAISVPHAGLLIPEEAAPYCQLTREQIIKDGDEGATEIDDLKNEVTEFISTDNARAIVDLNRPVDGRRADGVVKTHTIWDVPIYCSPPPEAIVDLLLDRYYHPYHYRLNELSKGDFLFAVDCHTMVAEATPIGPNPGTNRPEICVGNVHGRSFPEAWTSVLYQSIQAAFSGFHTTLNQPFSGGYITKAPDSLPWVQLEISRSQLLLNYEIRERVLRALRLSCEKLEGTRKSCQ